MSRLVLVISLNIDEIFKIINISRKLAKEYATIAFLIEKILFKKIFFFKLLLNIIIDNTSSIT